MNLVERINVECFQGGIILMPWTKFFLREFIIKNQLYFPSMRIMEDRCFSIAVLCLAKTIRVIDGCFYVKRPNQRSLFHASPQKYLKTTIDSFPEVIAYMEDLFSKELVSPLSRENQLTLKSFVVFDHINIGISFRAILERVSVPEIDQVCRELVHESSTVNEPEVTRALITTMLQMIEFHFRRNPRKLSFQLLE